MKSLAWMIAFVLPALTLPGAQAETVGALHKQFAGAWKLVSIEGPLRAPNGKAAGVIMYDGVGSMSVQFSRGDRPLFAARRPTEAEKAAAYDSYVAYYGTYTFEPENGIVIHHLQGSKTPGQDSDLNIRYFELKGNRLILSIANDGKGGRIPRKDATSHLTWEKLPAK